ncbi:MAG: hypothetical protein K2N65_02625, partial [Anaeroplasmataceae bacterium]|nr:hypothetical protein [Anaeroplasmataceae bacterium]
MKRIVILMSMLLIFCVSCKKQVDVTFAEGEEILVYAIEEKTSKIKEIRVEYSIENEEDLFTMYTIYQNILPLGYSSPANPNVHLLEWKRTNKAVFYSVDNFILFSDLSAFQEVLLRTGKCLNLE